MKQGTNGQVEVDVAGVGFSTVEVPADKYAFRATLRVVCRSLHGQPAFWSVDNLAGTHCYNPVTFVWERIGVTGASTHYTRFASEQIAEGVRAKCTIAPPEFIPDTKSVTGCTVSTAPTTPVTAADLAVGQVWSGVPGHAESIVRIANGRVETQCECGNGVNRSIDEFVEWLWFTPKSRLLTAPSPIPHPSALGDVYAACKAIVQRWDDARLDDNDMDAIRAAIAKAEGVER